MKLTNKISLCLAVFGLTAVNSQAQDVLGSFQGSGDPTDVGWSDWSSSIAITATAPPTDNQYSFVAAGVPGYAQSLEITPANPGYSQNLSYNLNSSQMAAFYANSYVTFTFSAPAAPQGVTGGYSQIASFYVNAPGWGFTALPWSLSSAQGNTQFNQSGQPTYYYYGGSPFESQTVTINYSSILPQISANPGYMQFIFLSESGGGAPADYFINNVVLSTAPFGVDAVPEPCTMALLGLGAAALTSLRRRSK